MCASHNLIEKPSPFIQITQSVVPITGFPIKDTRCLKYSKSIFGLFYLPYLRLLYQENLFNFKLTSFFGKPCSSLLGRLFSRRVQVITNAVVTKNTLWSIKNTINVHVISFSKRDATTTVYFSRPSVRPIARKAPIASRNTPFFSGIY